jgi:outer membrane protein OmpA-like peptidoglycan-associated protein
VKVVKSYLSFNLGFRELLLFYVFACLMAGCAGQKAKQGALSEEQKIGPWQAVIGGLSDTAVGSGLSQYMDAQAKELQSVAQTQRIGDGIIVTLNNEALFAFDSADLREESREPLQKIAAIFLKYPKTNLTVAGHTDNIGSVAYNIQLSERRAKAVADDLAGLGVPPARIRIMGLGFERPVASNDSAEGRASNRRVEIHVAPSEELRSEDRPPQG